MNKESGIKYIHESTVHNLKAPKEIVPHLINAFNPSSVLDVGCGTCTFLHVFKEHGIEDILGLDGDWVNTSQLFVEEKYFLSTNLEQPFSLNKKFDLVLSLEVAEHLDPGAAEIFVESLTKHGDVIIFSAALPGQGGQNHINERPIAYWQKLFEKHGYYFVDYFRERFWNNKNIDWWYSQNMFLVIHDKEAKRREINIQEKYFNDVFHPGCLFTHIEKKNESNWYFTEYNKILKLKHPFPFYFKLLLKSFLKVIKLRNEP